jgi:hypothetical protein
MGDKQLVLPVYICMGDNQLVLPVYGWLISNWSYQASVGKAGVLFSLNLTRSSPVSMRYASCSKSWANYNYFYYPVLKETASGDLFVRSVHRHIISHREVVDAK